MNYKFPEIFTIDDVIPYVKDREEFVIGERDFGTVINYAVSTPDTFNMINSDDMEGAIRRECRGIKFYPDGKIAARLFHKFFNLFEKEETQLHNLNMDKKHTILEKLDGSMLHPMIFGNEIRWMTKMGITDVSIKAEKYIKNNSKYDKFAEWCIENNMTPIFEYTSPDNRIVISYREDKLTLLAVRDNYTGEYKNVA